MNKQTADLRKLFSNALMIAYRFGLEKQKMDFDNGAILLLQACKDAGMVFTAQYDYITGEVSGDYGELTFIDLEEPQIDIEALQENDGL